MPDFAATRSVKTTTLASYESSKPFPSSLRTSCTVRENEESPRSRGSIGVQTAYWAQASFKRSTLFPARGLTAHASATNLACDKGSRCATARSRREAFRTTSGTPRQRHRVGLLYEPHRQGTEKRTQLQRRYWCPGEGWHQAAVLWGEEQATKRPFAFLLARSDRFLPVGSGRRTDPLAR